MTVATHRTGSTPMRAHARFAVLAAAAVTVAAVPVLGLAVPAQAHNYLVASTPVAGETLTALPEQFSITTNEALLDLGGQGSGFALQVQDDAGLYYGDGCVDIADASMSATAALGEPGVYTVLWQVVSADGHTVDDEFQFTWAPAEALEPSPGSASAPDCGASAGGSESDGVAETPAEPAAPESDGAISDALWIGGAVLAVAAAILLTLGFTRRKK